MAPTVRSIAGPGGQLPVAPSTLAADPSTGHGVPDDRTNATSASIYQE